jgi:hypothetical protein
MLLRCSFANATGGLNTIFDESALNPTAMVVAENMVIEPTGSRRKRGAQAYYNSSAITDTPTISGIWEYWKGGVAGAPAQKLICHTSDGKFFMADMDGVWNAAFGTGFQTSKIPCATIFEDKIILSTSSTSDVPQMYDQTTLTALSTAPIFQWSLAAHNRLFVGGTPATPHRISYSNISDPTTWTGFGTGGIDIRPGDGDEKGVVGGTEYKDLIVIFKRDGIYRIQGFTPDEFTVGQIADSIGALSHRCIVKTENDVYFASRKGFHSLSATMEYGDVATKYVSFPIQNLWRDQLNQTTVANWQATYHKNLNTIFITVSKSGSSTNNLILGYNVARDEWFTWPGVNAASLATYLDPTTGKEYLISGGYSTGKAVLHDQSGYSDFSTTAYQFRLKTPYIQPGASSTGEYSHDPAMIKGFNSITIYAKSNGSHDNQVNYRIKGLGYKNAEFQCPATGFVWGTGKWGDGKWGGTGVKMATIMVDGYGRGIQFDIVQGELAKSVEILGYDIDYEPSAYAQRSDGR